MKDLFHFFIFLFKKPCRKLFVQIINYKSLYKNLLFFNKILNTYHDLWLTNM